MVLLEPHREPVGPDRRTTAWRTQGTDSKAPAPSARSSVKRLPASCGAAFARIVDTLLRVTSPSTRIERTANTGPRAAQRDASQTKASAASDAQDVGGGFHQPDVERARGRLRHGLASVRS